MTNRNNRFAEKKSDDRLSSSNDSSLTFMERMKLVAPQIFDFLNPNFFSYRFYHHLISFLIDLKAKKKIQQLSDQLYYRRYFYHLSKDSDADNDSKKDFEGKIKQHLFFFYCQRKKLFKSQDLSNYFSESLNLDFFITYDLELLEKDPSYLCSHLDLPYRMYFILLRNNHYIPFDEIMSFIKNFCPIYIAYQFFNRRGKKRSDYVTSLPIRS